jgi:hypothetical protein
MQKKNNGKCFNCKVMVENYTSQTRSNLVPHLKLIHTIKKATKVIENLGSGTGQAQNCGRIKFFNEYQTSSVDNNWISHVVKTNMIHVYE